LSGCPVAADRTNSFVLVPYVVLIILAITRSVVAFLEKTAIAYRQNLAFFLQFWWYAIAVFSKNAMTLRVNAIIGAL